MLSIGHTAEYRAAKYLAQSVTPARLVMADMTDDTDAVRKQIKSKGAAPNILRKRTCRSKR